MNKYSQYWNKKLPDNLTKSTYSIWLDSFKKELDFNNLPILDLGCGNGDDSKWLIENNYKVVSSDFSISSIEHVKKINPNTILLDMSNIEDCIFVPKEDAFAAQLESMGDDAVLLEGLDENPLPDAYKVVVKDLTMFDQTVSELKAMQNVENVRENSDLADKLVNVRKAVTIVIAGMVALLFIVSLFIISNTIRITMFSRKLEISIMKAVGATNWFIRWPFMIEGMVIGVTSSLVSFGLLAGLYQGMIYVFKNMLAIFTPVSFGAYAGWILLIFMGIGIFTGSFGSLISMGKYLKEQGSVVSEE